MKSSHVAWVLLVAATVTSMPSHADDLRERERSRDRHNAGMQVVPVDVAAGQPGHGWQYFSDVRHGRAVVISPEGDYHYSRGHGLALVRKATGAG